MTESEEPLSLYRRIRRPLGRVRRGIKRFLWNRLTGREYRQWLKEANHAVPGSVENQVLLSVIVPVYDPPVNFLRDCVRSVLNQTARNWQLVISDDGSTDPAIKTYLNELDDGSDDRVVVLYGANGGISAAQNRALERVTSEFFGWLDHDDLLDPRALETMSQAIESQVDKVDVVYSDEDKIDGSGRHFDLYCKPDYSPELLMSQMYLCHFTVFRTELVRRHGGFRTEMDGAQDFDLALRLSPNLTRANTVHVSHPLYHWRAWDQSTASSIDAKPWAQDATRRAQQEHLERVQLGGMVTKSSVPGLNDVHPHVASGVPISVIIPTAGTRNRSGHRYVDRAIESLRQHGTDLNMEIIVVTTNDVPDVQNSDKQVPYITDNFNFSVAVNIGRKAAAHDLILLLNDDTEVLEPKSILRMVEILQQPGVGVVGAKLTYPNGHLQHVGIVLLPSGPTHAFIGKPGNYPGYFGSTLTPRNYSAVTAAAMMTKADTFDDVGGFDEQFARDFNDVDYCLKVGEAGYRVAWTPHAHFVHHEGVSIVRHAPDQGEWREFERRWSALLTNDPCYSHGLHHSIDRLYEPR